MAFDELLLAVKELNRLEKLRLMQAIVTELANEEIDGLQAGQAYPVWTPYDAFDAAQVMTVFIEDHHAE